MTPWLDDGDLRLYHGDALEVLRGLPDESVDCVVTSPPYWGLRCYGVDGQMGLESTPDLFVAGMVDVFREVRRVLAPHGTCWVNLGDSFAGSVLTRPFHLNDGKDSRAKVKPPASRDVPMGLKPKDLCGIPWRVAFALQADGWWLRSDIVWAKPNPMPESVTDRPTKAHEYVFLLTKHPRYWFDAEAVREPYEYPHDRRDYVQGNFRRGGEGYIHDGHHPTKGRGPDGRRNTRVVGQDGSEQHRDGERWPNPAGRNVRSVWTIATQPYPEAHFATFPEELARRAILAGCPLRVCRVCGKPSERIVEKELVATRGKAHPDTRRDPHDASSKEGGWGDYLTVYGRYDVTTVGWSDCGHNAWRPGAVLDPFMGSGTTAKVARDHQRHAVGIELNEQYLELAARRLQQLSLLTGDAA